MRCILALLSSLVLCQFADLETRGGDEDSMCLQEWPKLIIRAAESIKEGATFLKTVESSSRDDCDSRCCGNKACNVAVYTKFGQCFLFDCLNNDAEDFVCTFEQHTSFNTLVKTPAILNAYARWGLQHSAEQIVNSSTKSVHKDIVADVDDEGGCSRLAWQCDNKVNCIPAWHVCDGTEDCPDKSDELNCPATDTIPQDQAQELHVLKDVGESFEESAQTKIEEEKKKTGIQIILPLCLGLLLLLLALIAVYIRYRQARHKAGLCSKSQYKQLPKEDSDYLINGMYM
ncbi:Oidioi.mRNA.OKI2018_I69.PAR.g10271.t1.cds [Oikopleura dioica]|uniref:Oidioi.mRNA.OKI2018_I69.PAR.g10271.t1.cds n=1 Tax=Oikopleura dioica TaxID=34765 RepID=A0ABN7RVM2_OIKDI|nr:Oidioi.mRNA.OKI2018_I69.PAR.g10271.t1.cds [Oikopleura dioica]